MRFSLDIDLSFLFILYLSHLLSHFFHFLVVRSEHCALRLKRVWALLTRPTPSQVMSSNAYDLKETFVESYTESLTHPQFSKQGFLEDVEYDDTALEDMLHNAHRVHVYHSQREGLSVDQLSSSVSERTGRPVGEGAGRPAESSSQDAQIRTLLDRQKERILAECQAEN